MTETVENRGQQIFLLTIMLVVLAGAVFFRDPVLYLQGSNLFSELFSISGSKNKKGSDRGGELNVRSDLLKRRSLSNISEQAPDIFKYDRSVSRPLAPPMVKKIEKRPEPVKPQPVQTVKQRNPRRDSAEDKTRLAREKLEKTFRTVQVHGRIRNEKGLCALVSFTESQSAGRIYPVPEGVELIPDSGVVLQKIGLIQTTGAIYLVLETDDGSGNSVSKAFAVN